MKSRYLLAFLFIFSVTSIAEAKEPTELSWSGQIRVRPEFINNKDFNDKADDKKAFIGQRTRFSIKGKIGSDLKVFVMLQDARYWAQQANHVQTGRENESVDLYQAYFQLNRVWGNPVDVKIGRQTLVYGDQRLLGHLGWTDNARAHDAFKAVVHWSDDAQVDFFFSKEGEGETHSTSATSTSGTLDTDLYGTYGMFKIAPTHKMDLYYLVWAVDSTDRNVATYGARFAGKFNNINYTAEAAFQSGDWTGSTAQSANAFAITANYSLKDSWSTNVGLEYAHGSGDDDPNSGDHKTFVFPYHTNHAYYGHLDFFSWGNMNDVALRIKTKPFGKKTLIKADYHILSLDNANDNWLDVVGTTTSYSPVGTSTDAGQEVDLTVVHKYNDNLKMVAGYSWFTPGDAAKDRNSGNDDIATWGYAMAIVNF